jgi:hypothetical protein
MLVSYGTSAKKYLYIFRYALVDVHFLRALYSRPGTMVSSIYSAKPFFCLGTVGLYTMELDHGSVF